MTIKKLIVGVFAIVGALLVYAILADRGILPNIGFEKKP